MTTPVLITNTAKFAEVEGLVGSMKPSDVIVKVTTK